MKDKRLYSCVYISVIIGVNSMMQYDISGLSWMNWILIPVSTQINGLALLQTLGKKLSRKQTFQTHLVCIHSVTEIAEFL